MQSSANKGNVEVQYFLLKKVKVKLPIFFLLFGTQGGHVQKQ